MKKPLVTILTPCYNGEKYIQKYIDSVLNQTYDNIEIILINDGSNDKTEEIILGNKKKIEERGYKFKYFFQNNQGQAAAVNNGLKHISGKYLTLPDSDDMLTKDSIEIKTEFLEKNKEYGFVRTNVDVVNEKNIYKVIYRLKPDSNNKNIFDDLVFEKTYCTNGAYLLRIDSFNKVNRNREIFVSKGGQNWQILLPIAYKFMCGYIDKSGYIYVERKASHSHCCEDSYESHIERIKEHKSILLNTLKTIDLNQKLYGKSIQTYYLKKEMKFAIKYGKKDIANKKYILLKKDQKLDVFDKIYFYFGCNYLTKTIEKICKKFKKEMN